MKNTEVKLGHIDDMSGMAKGFDPFNLGRDTMFVIVRDGKLYAYKDVCPHDNTTSLPWKKDAYLTASQHYIVCSAHGALFDIDSGKCLRGPCVGQTLDSETVELRANGELWLVSVANQENEK